MAHENKEPLDVIVFSEVMYDRKNNISGEQPAHIHFIRNIAKPLFESWGYQVLILRGKQDYLDCFYRIIEHPRKHKEHKGKHFGFPVSGLCSVKRDCKERPIKEYYQMLTEPYVQYVGICIDEPERLKSLHKDDSKVSLLEKYNYTEEMARRKCEEYGLLSPCYELSKRGGCWFCPNAKLEEHREIRKRYPKSWEQFVGLEQMENIAFDKWNVYSGTLQDRERILKMQESYQQMSIWDFCE